MRSVVRGDSFEARSNASLGSLLTETWLGAVVLPRGASVCEMCGHCVVQLAQTWSIVKDESLLLHQIPGTELVSK